MTLTSPPPNDVHTLDEPEFRPSGTIRRMLPIVVHITIMLLLLYWLYSSQQVPSATKARPAKKLWLISQSFFVSIKPPIRL